MKIEKKQEIIEFINSLQDINDLNMSISEMLLSIINNDEITSPNELKVLSKRYGQPIKDIYFDKIIEYWGIDLEADDNEKLVNELIYPAINEIDPEEFKNNPYYKLVKTQNIQEGKLSLLIDSYRPFEIFAFDDIVVDEKYIEHSSLGYFVDKFPFIALNEKDVTWMSITPNEIKTMEKGLSKARGDVVVFGLGLGYFPFMASLKEEVGNITIIERDQNIINMFEKYLLPQFPNKEKIKIQKADAFDVMKKELKYDFAFVDLWHSAEDGIETYLKFKSLEANSPKVEFSYWLENSFYAFLRRAFISLLYEQVNGYKESQYLESQTSFDKLINHYYFKTKNLHISSVKEIEDLISNTSLLELAK